MVQEYYMLKNKEEAISIKMKSLIIKSITKGRITFVKDENEDDYPVTTILSGRKDIYILYFIACVLGWNSNAEYAQSIKDSHNSSIMEMACNLAEKEMVDVYGKLPEYFANKNGEYTEFYQNIFNPLYDKYYNRIAALADFELG